MEEKNTTVETTEAVEEETLNDMYVKFKKPYVFEKKEYEGLDLSKAEDITGAELMRLEKEARAKGAPTLNPVLSPEFALIFAVKVTSLPIEFFEALPAKEMLKIQTRTVDFFLQ